MLSRRSSWLMVAAGWMALTVPAVACAAEKKQEQRSRQRDCECVCDGAGALTLVSRSARVVPEIRAGKLTGFRIFSVRPGGPAERLGLKDGDVIRALAGVPITSPESALEGYSRARESKEPRLTVDRDGQQLQLPIDWTDLERCQP